MGSCPSQDNTENSSSSAIRQGTTIGLERIPNHLAEEQRIQIGSWSRVPRSAKWGRFLTIQYLA